MSRNQKPRIQLCTEVLADMETYRCIVVLTGPYALAALELQVAAGWT